MDVSLTSSSLRRHFVDKTIHWQDDKIATASTNLFIWRVVSETSCLSVCLYAYVYLSDDNFRKPWRRNYRKFTFAHPVDLHRQRSGREYGSSSYEGHGVKVKVTGSNMLLLLLQQPKSQTVMNLRLYRLYRTWKIPCKTSIDSNSASVTLSPAWGFRIWRIEWCDRHLCHVTGSYHA